MGFWVYILRCRDGAYYAGHTEDVEARVAQHQSGAIKGFTSSRLPVTLVWCGELPRARRRSQWSTESKGGAARRRKR
ncbi:GIY-YIG nuclease family protein [Sphingomonas psychrotolerans]|uniref:GIY-YIG nuclease family protein n=1 Tax=Sphingomonas psychrotolerans TaxID=1327635 RepID=A0ABU3N8C3_9SPHN|nr:GIY-YIG nuclease family protein [Sphingomonas psychrotolerans]MDT8760052.1 GIY-YIG nuclease family protein [Sphingomonas psychrotolerans]